MKITSSLCMRPNSSLDELRSVLAGLEAKDVPSGY